MGRLDPGEFLNDTLIEFGLKWVYPSEFEAPW
jgi:Ulp1 family protease